MAAVLAFKIISCTSVVGRKGPIRIHSLYVREQYFPDL